MSIGFIESNEETSRKLFYKKMVYLSTLGSFKYTNLMDFEFAEKRMYGRANRHFEPIIISGDVELRSLASSADSRSPLSALNFVVDAFEKLSQQFDKCALSGKINTSDTHLSKLKAHKAYQNPRKLYKDHILEISRSLSENIKHASPPAMNFDEFILKLLPMLETICKVEPFTFPGFVKSRVCPINASGLAIEVADLKPDNDLEKIKQFVASPNWEFYLNACNSYGFMVDMHMPWRIVADLAGPSTLEYSSVYGLPTTDHILNVAYKKAHRNYLSVFKDLMFRVYSESMEDRAYIAHHCSEGKVSPTTIFPVKYTLDKFLRKYDDLYFLELYCNIRFYEEESRFTDGEKLRLINECIDIARLDLNTALDSFERIINKTLDYRGAINYIIRRREILAD